jgi:hypothetical protein
LDWKGLKTKKSVGNSKNIMSEVVRHRIGKGLKTKKSVGNRKNIMSEEVRHRIGKG